jgi:hypothetical protein
MLMPTIEGLRIYCSIVLYTKLVRLFRIVNSDRAGSISDRNGALIKSNILPKLVVLLESFIEQLA